MHLATRRTRGLAVTLAAIVTLIALLAACNGDDDGGAPGPGATPSAGASSTPGAPPSTGTAAGAGATPVLPVVAHAEVLTDNLNVRILPSLERPVIGVLQPGDRIDVAGLSPDSQWLAIPLAGWAYYEPDWFKLDIEVARLPKLADTAVVPAMHPPGTSTGYPAVDRVIEAALDRDIDLLTRLAVTLELPCSAAPGLGGPPPCPQGTSAGTVLEVFAVSSCEGEHIPPSAVRDWVQRLYQPPVGEGAPVQLRLYAVIESPQQADSTNFPAGRWVAILAGPDGTGRSLWVNEEGIVRLAIGCGATPAGLMLQPSREAPRYQLRPLVPEPLDPV